MKNITIIVIMLAGLAVSVFADFSSLKKTPNNYNPMDRHTGEYHLSEDAAISLVTVEPGIVIYQKFGHSLLRIIDPQNKIDVAYNFGVVPFFDENFVSNFVKGDLYYYAEKSRFTTQYRMYSQLHRTLREYTLNLTHDQIQHIYDYMEWHVRPENRDYLYYFFHDNCTTRIRDMFEKAGGMELILPEMDKKVTYRQLLKSYLRDTSWVRLGLFFMLNSIVDRPLDSFEAMGLPDTLEYYFTKAWIKDEDAEEPLILQKEPVILNNVTPIHVKSDFWYSPLIMFSFLFILAVFISVYKIKAAAFDFVIFFIAGILGGFLLFLWFGTNHVYGHHNWNLVWAFPLHLLGSFLIFTKNRTKRVYFIVNTAILAALLPLTLFIRQKLPLDALPFILTLFVRSYILSGLKLHNLLPFMQKKSEEHS